MSRFNFTEITLASEADITTVMNNFNLVEENGAIVDDLPKVTSITLSKDNWVEGDEAYEYTISNQLIKAEPYNIKVLFTDISIVENAITPAPNSQQSGSIVLRCKAIPSQDLSAILIVTKGVQY